MSAAATSQVYVRSDRAFFHDTRTKSAIGCLTAPRTLTIYCGAGVTIDRTGLAWRDLIYDMLIDKNAVGANPEIQAEDAAILRDRLPPIELASILAEYNRRHTDNEQNARQALHRAIQARLYSNGRWQAGELCRNIVRLAVRATLDGTRVRIVTTNYDELIEEEFATYIDELREIGETERPGLDVYAIPESGSVRSISPHVCTRRISLTYLHGRIPREGIIRGRLALSEIDYSDVRADVEAELIRRFTRSSVLILGASMTDPPLLSALQATRTRDSDNKRFALVPITSTPIADATHSNFEHLKKHLGTRMTQFGVTLLNPDFHFQIAQFCQEVLANSGSRAYATAASATDQRHTYGQRLISWYEAWSKKDAKRGPIKAFDELCQALDEVRSIWSVADRYAPVDDEQLKLELWVRVRPDDSTRALALWASSLGILYDRPALKSEDLRVNSPVASVRGFTEGRAFVVHQAVLHTSVGEGPLPSRWRNFLSVPIILPWPSGAVPVGTVTLASMREHSSLPVSQAVAMQGIIDCMKNAGTRLLSCAAPRG